MNTLALEYEKYFHHWIEKHINLLKNGQLNEFNLCGLTKVVR